MIRLEHIVVATDFGDAADAALGYGRELSRKFGATLHVVNIVDDVANRTLAMAAEVTVKILAAKVGGGKIELALVTIWLIGTQPSALASSAQMIPPAWRTSRMSRTTSSGASRAETPSLKKSRERMWGGAVLRFTPPPPTNG